MTTNEADPVKDLEAEDREFKRANEILLAASSFFAQETRPATAVVVLLFTTTGISSGQADLSRAHRARVQDHPLDVSAVKSQTPSDRVVRDFSLIEKIQAVFYSGRGKQLATTRPEDQARAGLHHVEDRVLLPANLTDPQPR
jgi:hypothetical protein